MADGRRLVGDEGEGRAEAFLRDRGFRILGRNVRSPWANSTWSQMIMACWCLWR